MLNKVLVILTLACSLSALSQSAIKKGYWQQSIDYKLTVDFDVKKHQYKGDQVVIYQNNSSDTLNKVYFHLFNNAFQPGSEMDERLKAIADPDSRMIKTFKNANNKEEKPQSRIADLKADEIGYLHIKEFYHQGKKIPFKENGTILEVNLQTPIYPGQKTEFSLSFEAQVPLQIRRSGRNSSEGVAYSMCQWYPKMCEFDFQGWHANPYIAREFHGVWGNFDVKITIDSNYTLGGSGYLQNPDQVGHGYQTKKIKKKRKKKTTWHFIAPNVHDFTWAADDNYLHDTVEGPNGVKLHFIYKNDEQLIQNWKKLQPKTVEMLNHFNELIGPYPYKQYSIIQAGDGGMEYAMCTLITGQRSFGSLVGVTAHEMAHSWFQHILATNESKYEWMDEGFTSYISEHVMNLLFNKKTNEKNPYFESYNSYYQLVRIGKEQPLTTHADRYNYNMAYSIGAYVKGKIFLNQLNYIIGHQNLSKTIKRFYHDFKFTHPTPNDFKRTAERVSGAELDWYLIDWTQTTNTIDYGIKSVEQQNKSTIINLERIGPMPMPIDLTIQYKNGDIEYYYIPLTLMRYSKPKEIANRIDLKPWDWANPNYYFNIDKDKSEIKHIIIDQHNYMADIDKTNNKFEQ